MSKAILLLFLSLIAGCSVEFVDPPKPNRTFKTVRGMCITYGKNDPQKSWVIANDGTIAPCEYYIAKEIKPGSTFGSDTWIETNTQSESP